jgi:LacI family transcriptional regulator
MSTTVRLKDVAEAAGVDISTASTILGQKPKAARFAEATRQRIFEAALKLNYQPNAAAQALATRRTGTIGLTLHSEVPNGWANRYFAGQLVGVEEVCRERGYGLQINLYDLDDLDSFVFPKQVRQRAVDGVILAGWVKSGIIDRFADLKIPVVCIGENHDVQHPVPFVSVDHVAKAMEAIRYASGMGHRRIGYAMLPQKQKREIASRVAAAVRHELALAEVSFCLIEQESSADASRSGQEMLDQLMAMPAGLRPTVVIFTTLDLALGVMKAMRKRGLHCPDDLSLIADNNDDDLCELCEPTMTAMGQDLPQLGRTAATALIASLESGSEPLLTPHLSANPLAVRHSVARLSDAPQLTTA